MHSSTTLYHEICSFSLCHYHIPYAICYSELTPTQRHRPTNVLLCISQVTERHAYGRLLFIQCNVAGLLTTINEQFIVEIRNMSSFLGMELFVKVGTTVAKSIDGFTLGGIVKMSHISLAVLESDYTRIREMENTGLFVTE